MNHTYALTAFPNGLNSDRLSEEIGTSAIKQALDGISTTATDATISFKEALDAADKAVLDALVAAHSGQPPEDGTVDANGNPVFAPTFENVNMDVRWEGALYTATAGAQSMFDRPIVTELKLRGGWYELLDNNPVVGDYIEFSIVDKDNVLGLFAPLGLIVGTDVLELAKFVKTDYISPIDHGRQGFIARSAFDVMGGLYFRTTYHSTGANDVKIKVVFHTYE